MHNSVRRFGLPVLAFLFSSSMYAAPISGCNSDDTICNVYEGQTLHYPDGFIGLSGDVIVKDPVGSTVDVFRIFNDFLDTGGGTGLGTQAFLYGADLGDLPDPSTYSINALSILRAGTGVNGFYETDYLGNGTLYRIFTPGPEPSTLALIGLDACFGVPLFRRKFRQADVVRATSAL